MRGALSLLTIAVCLAATFASALAETQAEKLGYPSDARVLLLHADDIGMCQEANEAARDYLEAGHIQSAAVMVPCPWFDDFADWCREHPEADVGLHLTLTAEWKNYRWGPMTPRHQVPGLVDEDGFLFRSVAEVAESASAAEVEREIRAQIDRAIQRGLRPGHIDTHMGTLYARPDFVEAYLKVAVEYGIPAMVIDPSPRNLALYQSRGETVAKSVIEQLAKYPLPRLDSFRSVERGDTYEEVRAGFFELVRTLEPGITEIIFHPSVESEALRRITGSWKQRSWEARLFSDPETIAFLKKEGVLFTNWREMMRRHRERHPKTSRRSPVRENWGGWRGPRGDGSSLETGLPLRWNGETGENIAWKVELPGEGHASPIVWEDRIFTVACIEETQERVLLCRNAEDGSPRWQRRVFKAPLETLHRLNSRASSTPACDGERVYVTFLEVDGRTVPAPNVGSPRPITPGKIVVAAYGLDGERQWLVRVGDFLSAHGFCSCPVLHEDLVIVNGDHDGDAYIVALDRRSGEERWRIDRENKTRSYVTPIVREIDGRWQMVLSGSKSVASYDPATGKRHWVVDGPTEQFVASMVFDGEHLFLTGGFPDRHILAIRPDGEGNVTDTHIAWRTNRGAGYVPSPIVVGPWFLVVADNGVASCFRAKTGERVWMERLDGSHSASTVTADGLVYFLSDAGQCTVVRPGREFEVVAKNSLGERCSASPALSGGRIYIRGQKHLWAIEAKVENAREAESP